ncbi:DUF6356 family protein [Ramlibacter albus]|uniref:Capsule biosynthesis protein n=1 Tax=Ramlibacter albus TaxID=2079448 RepID=A0A923S126_9BURK|nr:DUF6356 family protein [Ramlibacter albus]MBC5763850.1 hypothetical protein [Ramlibacter albus]
MKAFTDHPASVGESYWEHMRFALGFSGTLFVAAGAALLHAVFPFVCEKTGSTLIKRLHARIVNR